MHNVNILTTPQYPYSINSRYAFDRWSDGGGDAFTLSIDGAGFTRESIIFVNGLYPPSAFVSGTQLTVPISAEDIATAGGFQVGVSNFPAGSRCAAYALRTFFVRNPDP